MQKRPIMYNPYLQFSKYGLLKSLNEVLTAFKLPHQRKETLLFPLYIIRCFFICCSINVIGNKSVKMRI